MQEQERQLWLAVLSQAAKDAKSHGEERAAAIAWLTNNSGNFQLVCEFAGVHFRKPFTGEER
jgi:hypothetical protein